MTAQQQYSLQLGFIQHSCLQLSVAFHLQAINAETTQQPAALTAQQHDVLQQQVHAETLERKNSAAAVEYVQRLLNAVTAENGDLRKQLVKLQADQQTDRSIELPQASFTGVLRCALVLHNAMTLQHSGFMKQVSQS